MLYNPILFQNQYRNPNALHWKSIPYVLPQAIASSQLAIINGNAYLFGGKEFSNIYIASLSSPRIWTDTLAHLPSKLYGSQLAIIGSTIYLFGGNADGYTTNHIYTAPITNPKLWTDQGGLLPKEVQDAQLFIADGYVYIAGGRSEINLTNGFAKISNAIYSASTSSPLIWTTLSSTLPQTLAASQVACIGNNVYLFGGITDSNAPTENILSAVIPNLSSWTTSYLPYPIANGSFFTFGDGYGYLATPGEVSVSPNAVGTRILKCSLSTPTQWTDTGITIPGNISESQVLFITHNNVSSIYLLGGNGNSALFETDFNFNIKTTSANVFNAISNNNTTGYSSWKIFGNY